MNTGWTGGAYPAGERIKIAYSRALVRAATSGALTGVPFTRDPVFGFEVPEHCPDVPDELLHPAEHLERPERLRRQGRRAGQAFAANFAAYADQAGGGGGRRSRRRPAGPAGVADTVMVQDWDQPPDPLNRGPGGSGSAPGAWPAGSNRGRMAPVLVRWLAWDARAARFG